ncbi:hypothetical protein TREMEDRAFT_60797 [Tremella mesenterica DSM 1558]|uniref:uncharacterized protein n=1 Tax=Tremella mesenterica (strain ATCC 24925 / CBS 8224 / DSM 1558 / NBRC 9311 / NRRL Y-6157 / RJB 2259-6 / UBC 559-6) TaxID=578456 RepID=UPI0003F497CF|nr:uncharacterized protein TREMEDRAFT_60797 [Tremella mesenterica DSM 1558]EIW71874.1 hypothetical protein TREMEDRAFT_60797 [Tremella mesenterica DSM 1558]
MDPPVGREAVRGGDTTKKKIPKVAFYVLGAAFTLSAGLTVLIFPYIRQAARLSREASLQATSHPTTRIPSSILHPHSIHPLPPTNMSTTPLESNMSIGKDTGSSASLLNTIVQSEESGLMTSDNQHESLLLHGAGGSQDEAKKRGEGSPEGMNTTTGVDKLNHSSTEQKAGRGEDSGGEEDAMGALEGFKALGIATGLVFGTAALGIWGTSYILGVNDMSSFSRRMRETLETNMPSLVDRVHSVPDSKDFLIIPMEDQDETEELKEMRDFFEDIDREWE